MTNFSVHPFCEIPQHRVLSLRWWLLCRPLLLCAVRRISRHNSKTWQGPLMQPYAHVCHMEYGLNPTTFKKVAKQCRTDKYETFRCFLLLYGVPWCFIMFDVSCEVIQRLPYPSLCSKGNADVSSLFLEPILWSGASLMCATFVGWSLTRRCSSFVPKQVEASQQKRNMHLFWFNDRITDFWGRLTSPKKHKTNEAETSCAQTPNDIARTSTWRCCPW